MADVFAAVDVESGRGVALKLLRSVDPADLRRFERELETLEALDHPAVVGLVAHGVHRGRPFLVLERCDGGSLASVLADGALRPERAAALGAALAAGLAHAHAHGVVHRDVKPSNVLLTADGVAKLGDFGIARLANAAALTGTGVTIGTAAYLAPEQARGEPAGSPADVYSLGLVVLEAATGERAFPGAGLAVAVARLTRPPGIPATLPAAFAAAIAAMTAMDPDERPSAATVATELERLGFGSVLEPEAGTAVLPLLADPTSILDRPSPAAQPTPVPAPARRAVPRWLAPAAAFVVGFVAVLVLGLLLGGGDDGGTAPTTATTLPATTTTASATTSVSAPPPAGDDEPERGQGRGNGHGNGRGNGDDE